MTLPTFADVQAAAHAIQDAVIRTPTLPAPALSELTGADVVLKLETLQQTGSFKVRGALARLLALSDEQRKAGVIAMSAGNHAQGVAYHARRLGIPATIVMPQATPFTKVERTEKLGARVVLAGVTLIEAAAEADRLARTEGLTFVHPYDDPRVICGQGSLGIEMLEDDPNLDALIVPVGGGGLIGGVALAAKAMKPSIQVFGVQAALFPSMAEALAGEIPSPAAHSQTLAEGIAVKTPGKLGLQIAAQMVDDVLLVGESALEQAVQLMLERVHLLAEGAGAAPLAALMRHPERFKGKRVGLIVSGGNIDVRLLSSILMRGLMRDGRMARLRIGLADVPGSLARVAKLIGDFGGNIVEIYHQRLFFDVPVKMAEVDAVIETRDRRHMDEIVTALIDDGFPTRLLDNNAR